LAHFSSLLQTSTAINRVRVRVMGSVRGYGYCLGLELRLVHSKWTEFQVLRVAGVTAGLAESNGSLLPGLWLTSPAACYQFCCLVNRGTMGVNSLPKTVTRQRRDCDLNPQDCREPGAAPETYARKSSMGYLYLFTMSCPALSSPARSSDNVVSCNLTPCTFVCRLSRSPLALLAAASAGFRLKGVNAPCCLRRRKFSKSDYEMVHS